MLDLLDLMRVAVGLFLAAPLPALGLLWWASARHARRLKVPLWFFGLPAYAAWLYKERRNLRGAVLWCSVTAVTLLWVGLLWASPSIRFGVGIALPAGLLAGGLVWLGTNYPHLPPHVAIQFALAEQRSREVVTEAVAASVGAGARVVSVHQVGNGEFEAEIVGPPGVSHSDLLDSLRGSLAESILAQSGRVVREVSVLGTAAKGRVRVRCATHDPYAKTMTLDEVRR